MNIVFLSNFFNHHQQPFSEALVGQADITYHFIATMPIPAQRKAFGYHLERLPSYVCPSYESDEQMRRALELLDETDVLIAGSAPEWMVRRCIRQNKLVFRYAERPVKKREPWKYLPRLIRWNGRNPFWKPIYLLCASAYTAGDYARFRLFRNKSYQWGYFPEAKRYQDINKMLSEKVPTDILWCGRFLDWKNPKDAIRAASRLKKEGYFFCLRFIGSGLEEAALRTMAATYELEDNVEFLGAMAPEQVRIHMEKAGIYLFTSNQQEGWGAVLNEAMNSGCAVIASHAIGAVPFLMQDKENGLIYPSGNVELLYEKIKYLLDNPEAQKRLGKAAYETIVNEWNAEAAAERVVKLARTILSGDKYPDLYESGLCSRAGLIYDH